MNSPSPTTETPKVEAPKPTLYGREVKEKITFRMLVLALPVATLITIAALWLIKASGFISKPEDIYATLLSLAVATCFAMAICGSTTLMMRITGANIPNEVRYKLLEEALSGNVPVTNMLIVESTLWLLWSGLCTVVYLHFA